MKSKEKLEQEMKLLMELELVRMKIRHSELMLKVLPLLVAAIVLGAFLIWLDARF